MLESPAECIQYSDTEVGAPRSRPEIYAGLVGGLRRMIELAEAEEVVFWTSGYAADAERLREALAQYRAGALTPPHRLRARQEIEQQIAFQRRELRRLAQGGHTDKDLRRFLHALPPRT